MADIIITHELPGDDVTEPRTPTVDDTVGTELICCGRSFCQGFVRHPSCGTILTLKSTDLGGGTAIFECTEVTCPDFGEEFEVEAVAA